MGFLNQRLRFKVQICVDTNNFTDSPQKEEKKLCRIQNLTYLCSRIKEATLKNAEIAQLVEHNLAKVRVASSSLVFRSFLPTKDARMVEW